MGNDFELRPCNLSLCLRVFLDLDPLNWLCKLNKRVVVSDDSSGCDGLVLTAYMYIPELVPCDLVAQTKSRFTITCHVKKKKEEVCTSLWQVTAISICYWWNKNLVSPIVFFKCHHLLYPTDIFFLASMTCCLCCITMPNLTFHLIILFVFIRRDCQLGSANGGRPCHSSPLLLLLYVVQFTWCAYCSDMIHSVRYASCPELWFHIFKVHSGVFRPHAFLVLARLTWQLLIQDQVEVLKDPRHGFYRL